jgi:hypothetical protein
MSAENASTTSDHTQPSRLADVTISAEMRQAGEHALMLRLVSQVGYEFSDSILEDVIQAMLHAESRPEDPPDPCASS